MLAGMNPQSYPVTFSVDYPDRQLNRLSTFFRIFAAIPILILAGTIGGASFHFGGGSDFGEGGRQFAAGGAGVLFIPVLLMLLFRRKYPRWWYDWNLQILRFSNRVGVYLLLMDDRYPSTDEEQSVHLDFAYPDATQLSRGLPIVKWLLAIPHWFILGFLAIAVFFITVFAWFAILFTGRYPRGAFDFVEGVLRWAARVEGYALTLVTDQYPPFSFD
jgi:uncharacterized protein DUF4389